MRLFFSPSPPPGYFLYPGLLELSVSGNGMSQDTILFFIYCFSLGRFLVHLNRDLFLFVNMNYFLLQPHTCLILHSFLVVTHWISF